MPKNKKEFDKAFREVVSTEFADIPENEGDIDYEFSEQFNAKMQRLIKEQKQPWYIFTNTVTKRVAIAAALVCVIILATLPYTLNGTKSTQRGLKAETDIAQTSSDNSKNPSGVESKPKKEQNKNDYQQDTVYVESTQSKKNEQSSKEESSQIENISEMAPEVSKDYDIISGYVNPNQLEISAGDISDNFNTSDMAEVAMSLSEMVNKADFIARIKVTSARSYLTEWGVMQTETTPEVLEVYKGNYNNEPLYTFGGIMPYEIWSQNEAIKEIISGHENLNSTVPPKYVREYFGDQYIPNEGDEFIFFAKYSTDEQKYYSLYAYQGTFKVVGDSVENSALKHDIALIKDIGDTFGIIFEENDLVSVPKEAFISKITELCKKN